MVRLLVHDVEQAVVGDHDQRVDLLLEALDALFAHAAPPAPSKVNGLVTTPMVSAPTSLDTSAMTGRSAGAGAAADAGGDEDHVRALQDVVDLVPRLLGGLLADVRVAARAQTAGQLVADPDALRRIGHQQRLRVGVDGDEFHAMDALCNHAVDRVRPAATYANDLDLSKAFDVGCRSLHFVSLLLWENVVHYASV